MLESARFDCTKIVAAFVTEEIKLVRVESVLVLDHQFLEVFQSVVVIE